jgi:hypothetical protein
MLESLPGVRFVGVRTRAIDLESVRDGVPRDDLPGIDEHSTGGHERTDLSPELAEALSGLFEEHQKRWLDTEIPAFGHETPRRLCETPEGRRRVLLEVRSMPTPHPSLAGEPMRRIREKMLRELGLQP